MTALLVIAALNARRTHGGAESRLADLGGARRIFLFSGRELVDATPEAREFLSGVGPGEDDLERLERFLALSIPDFQKSRELLPDGPLTIAESEGCCVSTQMTGGSLRIEIGSRDRDVTIDPLTHAALLAELSQARALLAAVPLPLWLQDASGCITWANNAYLELVDRVRPDRTETWPIPAVFAETPGRLHVTAADGTAVACDVRLCGTEAGTAGLALPADELERAERARLDFVQTLSRTFADLPIGLAVFDARRRLAVFNPALTDLTALPFDFLAARPTLPAFFDRLRDTRVLPEPKDYVAWRQRLDALEERAVSGALEETWSLPAGHTFRITGRPHPEGAIAILFEDITAEISVGRRFRAEIGLVHSALDAEAAPIALFAADGALAFANAAHVALFGRDPRTMLGTMSLVDCLEEWHVRDGEHQVPATKGERRSAPAMAPDGTALNCLLQRLPDGAILARFRKPARDRTAVHHTRRPHDVTDGRAPLLAEGPPA